MKSSKPKSQSYDKVEVRFPKCSEDHRLQLVSVNGTLFAIVFAPLESQGPIRLLCEEWSLILLAPIKSKSNVVIFGINLLAFGEVESEEGNINVHATNRLVKFADVFKPKEKVCQMGEVGEVEITDELGQLLYHYKLFDGIVDKVRQESEELLIQAQNEFLAALSMIANKCIGAKTELSLKEVCQFWKIPDRVIPVSSSDNV